MFQQQKTMINVKFLSKTALDVQLNENTAARNFGSEIVSSAPVVHEHYTVPCLPLVSQVSPKLQNLICSMAS